MRLVRQSCDQSVSQLIRQTVGHVVSQYKFCQSSDHSVVSSVIHAISQSVSVCIPYKANTPCQNLISYMFLFKLLFWQGKYQSGLRKPAVPLT